MAHIIKQIFALLNKKERVRAAGVMVLIILMAIAQMAGVGAILPFMQMLINPTAIESIPWLLNLYTRLGFTSYQTFLLYSGLLFLGVVVFSNAFSAFTTWVMLRFSWGQNFTLSRRLAHHYLGLPYSEYLKRNTSEMMSQVLGETSAVVQNGLVAAMHFVGKAAVALSIITLLFITDPGSALVVSGTMGTLYALVYFVIRRNLTIYGNQRTQGNLERHKALVEALEGIKDVKILGKERHFLQRFSQPSRQYVRAVVNTQVLSTIPRYLLETVSLGGMLSLSLYLSLRNEVGEMVPLLGLYAFAAYKLLPSMQEMLKAVSQMRTIQAALDHFHAELGPALSGNAMVGAPPEIAPIAFTQSIKLDAISFAYENAAGAVLHDLTVSIGKGESIAFVGQTGAGKTTLVDLLLGLLEPTAGSVLVDDQPIVGSQRSAWQKIVGYVPQTIYLCDDTIARNIAFGIPDHEIDRAAMHRAARIASLPEFVDELPLGYDTVIGDKGIRLSGGQRQRIGVARALYRNPQVLIFDEATSSLDGVTEDTVMRALEEAAAGRTMIMIAHRLTTVRNCNRIHVLEKGRIVESGTYDELMSSETRFRALSQRVVAG